MGTEAEQYNEARGVCIFPACCVQTRMQILEQSKKKKKTAED